jgi:hypothetical protein
MQDYNLYIKLLLILTLENKIISKKQLIKTLNINDQIYNKLIQYIQNINKPKLLYLITINNSHQFITINKPDIHTGIHIARQLPNTHIHSINITEL